MAEAYILEAVRTPIGKRGGALANIRPDDLAAQCLNGLIDKTGIDPAELIHCVQHVGPEKLALVSAGILAAWWFSGLLPTFQQLNGDSGDKTGASGAITIPLNTQN